MGIINLYFIYINMIFILPVVLLQDKPLHMFCIQDKAEYQRLRGLL